MKLQKPDREWYRAWERALRGWFYRLLPLGNHPWHLKRRAGFERRWALETRGATKRGFFEVFYKRFLSEISPGLWVELQAGDGLVGSLGIWLERVEGWQMEAWEHRRWPAASYRKTHPSTAFHQDRLISWGDAKAPKNPRGITTRGAREASGVCRAVRKKKIRPILVGIWNPTRRGVWESRLRPCGYRLEMVYERMEFYRLRRES
jgi:hypothetical protein